MRASHRARSRSRCRSTDRDPGRGVGRRSSSATSTCPPGVDFTPLFEGLPGDLCQCPHWGYVLTGSISLRYADGTEEATRAGEALLLAGRPHRLDRRGRHLHRVQPGRASCGRCSSTSRAQMPAPS